MLPKILLTNVVKSFGTKKVLQGVDLQVEQGHSMVIIGGSGTGKSVMLKSILGLVKADHGSIKIDGMEMIGAKGKSREVLLKKFGMLFQGGALFDSLPIWQNVAFGLIYGKNINKEQARFLAIDKLKDVGMGEAIADLYPAELSGGMQKRVALARAIATSPEIIFFDEPTTGLDPIMADVINDLIVKCVKKLGATALTITHDMASARKIADHVAMIHQGRILWSGPVEDLDNSGNPYVDQFIHGSAKGPITNN